MWEIPDGKPATKRRFGRGYYDTARQEIQLRAIVSRIIIIDACVRACVNCECKHQKPIDRQLDMVQDEGLVLLSSECARDLSIHKLA